MIQGLYLPDCMVYEDTGSRLEILLLERNSHNRWQALVKPGKRPSGSDLSFGNGLLRARVIDIIEDGSIWSSNIRDF